MFSNLTLDAFTRLSQSENAEMALEAMVDYIHQCDFAKFTYTALKPNGPSPSDADVTMVSNMDPVFRSYYAENRLDEDDPAVDRLKAANYTPIFLGNNNPEWSPPLLDNQQRLIDTAYEVGLGAAVGIVLPPPTGLPNLSSGILISSMLEADAFQMLWREKGAQLQLILNLSHQHTGRLLARDVDAIRPLSPREVDCLLLIAQGRRTQYIADYLGIAEITVHVHLKNAREKLKAKTLPHAAAKAIRYGFIVP